MQKFLKKLLLFPLLAIFSRKFYIPVICYFRGYGQGHLLRSCGLATVLVMIAIIMHFYNFFHNEMYPVARGIPEFDYQNAVITVRSDTPEGFWKKDDEGNRYVAYTYENGSGMLGIYPDQMHFQSDDPQLFEVEELTDIRPVVNLYANNFCFGISRMENFVCVSYKVLTSDDSTAVRADELVQSFVSRMTMAYLGVTVVVLYFMILVKQCLFAIMTSLLSLFLQMLVKISLPRDALFRLNVYANTLPLALFVISAFFIDNPQIHHALTNPMVILTPLIYVYMALSDFRNNLIESVNVTMKNNGQEGTINHIKVNELSRGEHGEDQNAPGNSPVSPDSFRSGNTGWGSDDDQDSFTP